MAAEETYPGDLKYHPEHDWARIEGDEATVGITWFAQDALGELVHFEAPEPGATVSKDASYGEVESVKAVSDVVAPLSGEILEVNQKVVEAPETVAVRAQALIVERMERAMTLRAPLKVEAARGRTWFETK